MIKTDKTKRSFFKKAAAAVGFVAAASYLGKFIITRSNSVQAINDNSEHDAKKQKTAWLQKEFSPMTDNDKKQMLDEILDNHNQDIQNNSHA